MFLCLQETPTIRRTTTCPGLCCSLAARLPSKPPSQRSGPLVTHLRRSSLVGTEEVEPRAAWDRVLLHKAASLAS
jgi:hypothetical protein